MVDVWLFANLLKASRNVKKICIVGDEDQLPSVGPGSVLRDMIASEQFPLIRLDRIFRQKEGNTIIQLAHDINHGITEHIGNSKDTGLIRCRTQDIREAVIRVVSGALEKGYSMDDIQVLSPMYGGAAGIDALNKSLQDYFNPADPDKREVRVDYTVFREGDKILQKKNQPDDDVFNGDIGVIAEIIDASESVDRKTVIVADFQGNFVEYTNENWENITLAYCISVHKAQGSEYPIVIMPFSSYMYIMLQRKLIYTAVSRARKSLILIGDINAMINGVKVTERSPRMTTLAERLKTYMNGLSDDAYAADF
jgi:exodeoxyribonuclease V alpha subunit